MATPKQFRPAVHRTKLLRQFEQLQLIIQKQLDRVEENPDAITASMFSSLIDGLRKTVDLLSSLEKMDEDIKRRAAMEKARADTLENLPNPVEQPMPQDPKLKLPFPLRSGV